MTHRLDLNANDMLLTVHVGAHDPIVIDLRQLLHDTCSLDKIKRFTRPDGTTMLLSTTRGKFAGIEKKQRGYAFVHKKWRHYTETITDAAVARAIEVAKAKAELETGGDEVEFVKECTREARDEEGRANAIDVD